MGLFHRKAGRGLPEGTVRMQVRFTGRVQHVGFRYELKMLAQQEGVTGTVSNEPDGSVLAELQGQPEAISGILAELALVPRFVIDSAQKTPLPPVTGEAGFRVRGY